MDPDQSDSTKQKGEGFLIKAARRVGSTLGRVVAKTGLSRNTRQAKSSRGQRHRQKSHSSKKAGVPTLRARARVKKSRAKRSKARKG